MAGGMKYSALLVLMASLLAAEADAQSPSSSTPVAVLAALPPAERQAHEELIALRVASQAAFNKVGASGKVEDMEALLKFVHPDCLLTAMNGQSARGKQGILEYFNRHMINKDHSIAKVQHEFEADHLSILLSPDIAINRGTAMGTYSFTDGAEFVVNCRWTATMARKDGAWTVIAFQFGPSIFDNPVVDALKGWIYKGVGIAGVAGLLIGLLIGRRRRTEVSTKA